MTQAPCPITFRYRNQTVRGFGSEFTLLSAEAYTPLSPRGRRTRALRYRHEASRTEWTVHEADYPAYQAHEWQVDIRAVEDTDIFSDMGYDLPFAGGNGHIIGNLGDAEGLYALYDRALSDGEAVFENRDGRSTHGVFPYFRVETDALRTFAVLSWQGRWFSRFTQTEDGVRMLCGQACVYTRLHKGEVFRIPLLLVMPYEEFPENTWRRFFTDCQMAWVKGAPIRPMLGIFNGQCSGLTAEGVSRAYERYRENRVYPDFWWFDAGWGTDGTGPHNARDEWYHGVNFECDYSRFTDGLGAFGRRLRDDGVELMLWFEPECVRTPPEQEEGFYRYHPDFDPAWFLGTYRYEWCGITLTARLLNLGDPACRRWLADRICTCLDEAHASIYRQDFNIPPASVFQNADAEDRRGMAENLYCQGYLAFLDDIAARYPGMLMDSCASGGGRLDLETMRRMFPLHYSDHQDVYPADCETRIYMTRVVSRWFPYVKNFVGAVSLADRYARRAALAPMLVPAFSFAELETADFGALHTLISEWQAVNPAYMGDVYDLEPPDRRDDTIKAYMHVTREKELGFAVVLSPDECGTKRYTLRPQGLAADLVYSVADWNGDGKVVLTDLGGALMENGIEIEVSPRDSYLYTFTACGKSAAR